MQRVFITGGTGSFGKASVAKLLNDNPAVERLVIFSRDELQRVADILKTLLMP